MRATLTLLTHCCALAVTAQFAPAGAQWTYDQEDAAYTMTVVGDTLLQGHTCSIIQGSSFSSCWQSQAYTYQNGDTVFWSDDQYLPQFFELYRWNAQVGESWDVWTNGPVTVTYTVLSTGTTTVNGQALRTMNVAATDTQEQWAQSSGVLIEHIGDTLFMFPWLAAFCDAIVPWPLRCYSDNSLGTFQRPGVVDCSSVTGMAETTHATPSPWYPSLIDVGTPTMISSPDAHAGPLEVFDPSGRRVAMLPFANGQVTLMPLHAGCYVLRWANGGRWYSQRILVR